MNYWYLLAAIPVFGLLVFVHEFGHFIAAKWAGIRVEEFGLGFPPALVSFRRRDQGGWEVFWFGRSRDPELSGKQTPFTGTSGGESTFGAPVSNHTVYSLNLLPIGGFVRMPGENGDIHDPDGNYDPQSFAAKSAGKRVIVLVAGVIMNFLLAMGLFTIAYTQGEPTSPALIGQVAQGSPAAAAQLQTNDTIVSVNGQSVKYFNDVVDRVNQAVADDKDAHETVPIDLEIQRQGAEGAFHVTVNARVHPPANQGKLGIAVSTKVVFVSSPAWEAPFKGIVRTFDITHQFVTQVGQMITGAVQPQLSGPAGIVKITGQIAQNSVDYGYGWWPILNLTAILSLNLAIVNILPFPALDGGRIVLILIELLRGGKRLKPEREGLINLVGMAILLTLMVVITISDFSHWGS